MTDSTIMPLQAIQREALQWFLRLRAPDCTPDEKQAFEHWLTLHTAHEQAFKEVQTLWNRIGILEMNPLQQFELLSHERSRHNPPSTKMLQFTLAVTAMVLLVIGSVWWWKEMQVTVIPYQTAMGEIQAVTLPDGTLMEMNTNTSLSVQLSSQERRVILDNGEVYLTIAHEEERPFLVLAKGGKIWDIGTQFSIYTQEDKVFVAVTEGMVRVELDTGGRRPSEEQVRHLTAGKRLSYTPTGTWSEIETLNPQLIATWRGGKLIFEGMTLRDALQEVRRYWPGQIILADSSLAETKLKGIFDIQNLSGFFHALPQILPVQITQDQAGRMILSRN